MFEHRLLTEIGVLVVRSKGPLSTNDISALNVDADSNIEDNGAFMGFMICAARFHGWEDFEGAVLHCNFVRDHHQKISKVAFISDSNFLAALPELASHFISAKVKHFRADEEFEALISLHRRCYVGGRPRNRSSTGYRPRKGRFHPTLSDLDQHHCPPRNGPCHGR